MRTKNTIKVELTRTEIETLIRSTRVSVGRGRLTERAKRVATSAIKILIDAL